MVVLIFAQIIIRVNVRLQKKLVSIVVWRIVMVCSPFFVIFVLNMYVISFFVQTYIITCMYNLHFIRKVRRYPREIIRSRKSKDRQNNG